MSCPIALFDRVCSYVSAPVLDQLLVLSAVCRSWLQLLDGDASGHCNCWRHAPLVTLSPHADNLSVDPGQRTVRPPHYESALRSLRRVPSVLVSLGYYDSFDAGLRVLDLFPYAPSSSAVASDRQWLSHLRLSCSLRPRSDGDSERLRMALSRCLLRCAPLRSLDLFTYTELVPTSAALRHVGGSTRLVHLEIQGATLSAMVWGDALQAAEAEAVRAWRGATTVQSLILNSLINETDMAVKALCVALPSLSYLHLPQCDSHDAVQYVSQHLGDRLTFLRLSVNGSSSTSATLPQSVTAQLSALRSLCINIKSNNVQTFQLSEHLHLLSLLTELTILDERDVEDGVAAPKLIIASPLPAGLTYLQLLCRNQLIIRRPRSAGSDLAELAAVLPPSLLCLSLTLPDKQLSDRLLQSIPAHCPLLTHCFVDNADWHDSAEWRQKLDKLRSALGEEVWCDSPQAVEEQRLDRRWQREVGVQVLGYEQRLYRLLR